MALGTTNITTTLVKNTLSEDSNAVSHLGTSPNINKWSPNRPGIWYSNNTGGSNWLPSIGTQPTFVPYYPAPHQLGKFRGYEHTYSVEQKPTYFTPQSNVIDGSLEIGGSGQPVYYQVRLARGQRTPVAEELSQISNAWNKVRVYWYLNDTLQKIDPPQYSTPFTVPASGYVESEFTPTIYSSYNVKAVPYYTDVEGDIQYSMIEDGFKNANVSCFSLSSLFIGTLSNVSIDWNNPMYIVYDTSIERVNGGYTTSLYVRLRIEGNLITPSNPVELYWSGQWNIPETKYLYNQSALADREYSGSMTVYLEGNTSAGSTGWWVMDSVELNW